MNDVQRNFHIHVEKNLNKKDFEMAYVNIIAEVLVDKFNIDTSDVAIREKIIDILDESSQELINMSTDVYNTFEKEK